MLPVVLLVLLRLVLLPVLLVLVLWVPLVRGRLVLCLREVVVVGLVLLLLLLLLILLLHPFLPFVQQSPPWCGSLACSAHCSAASHSRRHYPCLIWYSRVWLLPFKGLRWLV